MTTFTKKFIDFIDVNESFIKRTVDGINEADETEEINQDMFDAATASAAVIESDTDDDIIKSEDSEDISQNFSTSSEAPPIVVGL